MSYKKHRIKGNIMASSHFGDDGKDFYEIHGIRFPERFGMTRKLVPSEFPSLDQYRYKLRLQVSIYENYYVSNGVVYFVDTNKVPKVAFTPGKCNPVLRHLDEAWQVFNAQKGKEEGEYYLAGGELENILADKSTRVFDLTNLRLRTTDPSRNLAILEVGTLREQYTQLPSEELRLAHVGILGLSHNVSLDSNLDSAFEAYMEMLATMAVQVMVREAGEDIKDSSLVKTHFSVALLTPEYVLRKAASRPFARVCSLRYDSLNATVWGLGAEHYMVGFIDADDVVERKVESASADEIDAPELRQKGLFIPGDYLSGNRKDSFEAALLDVCRIWVHPNQWSSFMRDLEKYSKR